MFKFCQHISSRSQT